MSKHTGRKQLWTQQTPKQYASALGNVLYQGNAWYAILEYKTLATPTAESGLAEWDEHRRKFGPYKRPRNAMIALEREAVFLKNRYRSHVLIGNELWGEPAS